MSYTPLHHYHRLMKLETRRAALAEVLEGFTGAHDRMLEVHGLRLPKHLAYAMGWWQGLSTSERTRYEGLFGEGPLGIGAWLCEGRYDRPPTLAREPRDPAELVCVFAGPPQDGGRRWALWYNDPAELPRLIAGAMPDEELEARKPTLIATICDDILRRYDGQDAGVEVEETLAADPVLQELFDWRDEVSSLEDAAYRSEAILPAPELDVVEPWIDGWEAPGVLITAIARLPDSKNALVATARDKLAAEPGWGLAVGRALHSLGDTAGTGLRSLPRIARSDAARSRRSCKRTDDDRADQAGAAARATRSVCRPTPSLSRSVVLVIVVGCPPARLARPCRYLARPPLALDRLDERAAVASTSTRIRGSASNTAGSSTSCGRRCPTSRSTGRDREASTELGEPSRSEPLGTVRSSPRGASFAPILVGVSRGPPPS